MPERLREDAPVALGRRASACPVDARDIWLEVRGHLRQNGRGGRSVAAPRAWRRAAVTARESRVS